MPKLKKNEAPASYLDGAEQRVLGLLQQAPDLESGTAIAADSYGDFSIRYHLCSDRSVLLRPFRFAGLNVLELGAGMGGVSRFLAEQCAHLTVVEGTPERLDACRERLRDLSNWTACNANIQDFSTDRRFDVVLLIGVLEYAELYADTGIYKTPFDAILAKAVSLLTEDGVLFVAIENQLGMKYWAGASEDHSARRFDGIAGYADRAVPRTFSRQQLVSLLNNAGLTATREYFPAADYKVPHSVLSREMLDSAPGVAVDVMSLRPAEDYAMRRLMLFPDSLAMGTVANAGLLAEFANSFLFVSARNADSQTLARVTAAEAAGEIGWHYTLGHRGDPTVTTFYRSALADGSIEVSKARLFADHPSPSFAGEHVILWHGQERTVIRQSPSVLSTLRRYAYYSDWAALDNLIDRFLAWSFARWTVKDQTMIQGAALDAVVTNALFDDTGFSLFDLEWEWGNEFPRSWFILRNILVLHEVRQGPARNFPYTSLGAWYAALCRRHGITPDLAADMDRELTLQQRIRLSFDRALEKQVIEAVFNNTLPCIDSLNTGITPQKVLEVQLASANAEIQALQAAVAATAARLASRPYRLAAWLMALRRRYPGATGILRRLYIVGERIPMHAGVLVLCMASLVLTMALMPPHKPEFAQFREMKQAKVQAVDLPTFVNWSTRQGETPAQARMLFQQVDTNHDGKIEYDEWRAYVQSSQQH